MVDIDPLQAFRLLIGDVDPARELITDDQATIYLALNGGDWYLAAADGLDAIAASEVMVSKVIRTQDLQTNGAAVAAGLHAQAESLRARAAVDLFDLTPAGQDAPYPPELTPPVVQWDDPSQAPVWGL